jgi:hypothetical protein
MPVSAMTMVMRVHMIRVLVIRVIMIVSVIVRDLVFVFHRVEFL